jgi:hypothetical protein
VIGRDRYAPDPDPARTRYVRVHLKLSCGCVLRRIANRLIRVTVCGSCRWGPVYNDA